LKMLLNIAHVLALCGSSKYYISYKVLAIFGFLTWNRRKSASSTTANIDVNRLWISCTTRVWWLFGVSFSLHLTLVVTDLVICQPAVLAYPQVCGWMRHITMIIKYKTFANGIIYS
jgi:hypothetical protein